MIAIDGSFDAHARARNGKGELARDHLQQLHAAGSHAGQKRFRRRNGLPRTSILHRTVDHEVMIARAAHHPTERVCRLRFRGVLPDVHQNDRLYVKMKALGTQLRMGGENLASRISRSATFPSDSSAVVLPTIFVEVTLPRAST